MLISLSTPSVMLLFLRKSRECIINFTLTRGHMVETE